MKQSRRDFLRKMTYLTTGAALIPGVTTSLGNKSSGLSEELFFDISLAEWSLHKTIFAGEITNLDFPATAKNEFGISAIEYVNQFFKDKARDQSYLQELNTRCSDLGVNQLLIMIDGEGDLAVNDEKERKKAVENHHKWIEAAHTLGCHSIRVNLFGDGTAEEIKQASVDSLGSLCEYAKDYDVNVLVENHGGHSSNAEWLVDVMEQVNMDNCGTLPDFGNFCIKREGDARWDAQCVEEYDKYKGVEELMPFAKGVSAKSYAFNNQGYETTIDYARMLKIVKSHGFNGYIGIEYEGSELNEFEGIRATKQLLERVGKTLSQS